MSELYDEEGEAGHGTEPKKKIDLAEDCKDIKGDIDYSAASEMKDLTEVYGDTEDDTIYTDESKKRDITECLQDKEDASYGTAGREEDFEEINCELNVKLEPEVEIELILDMFKETLVSEIDRLM